MYRKNIVFPVEFEIKTLRTTLEANMDLIESQKDRLNQLNELDEKHVVDVHHTSVIQQQRSKWHDRFIKKNMFHEGECALLYDSRFKRDFKGKLRTRWLGPHKVETIFDNENAQLAMIDEQHMPLIASGHRL